MGVPTMKKTTILALLLMTATAAAETCGPEGPPNCPMFKDRCWIEIPCPPHECIKSWKEIPCVSHVPVGFHSHSTHYQIEYSEADLRWNKTRSDIRRWLH